MVVAVEVVKSPQVLGAFLKTEQRESAGEIDVGCERERGSMDYSKVLTRAAETMELPWTEMVKGFRQSSWLENSGLRTQFLMSQMTSNTGQLCIHLTNNILSA